jgi:hypothetical protein
MAWDVATTARLVQTHLEDSNLFFSVDIERPGQPRGEGPSATIEIVGMRVAETTLTYPIELHTLRVRLWRAMNTAGAEAVELERATLTSQVLDLFYGDFALGGNIRNVDVGGQYGEPLAASFVDETLDDSNARYHIADITLPLIVDGATAFVA